MIKTTTTTRSPFPVWLWITFLVFFSFSTSLQVPCPILWISVTKCEGNIKNSFLEQNCRGYWNNSSSGEEVEMFFSLSYVRQTRTGQSITLRHVWQRQSGYKTGWVNTDNELVMGITVAYQRAKKFTLNIHWLIAGVLLRKYFMIFNFVLRFLFFLQDMLVFRFTLSYQVQWL